MSREAKVPNILIKKKGDTMKENKIGTQTYVRTAFLIIALINTVITACGANPLPFSEEELYEGISAIVTVVASLWAWWENNSFTKAAIEADKEYERIKNAEKELKEE